MSLPPWPFLAALLLLASHGLQCLPLHPACPVPCLCQGGPLLNCSSSGLSLAPQHSLATVTEVDLSHNLLKSVTLRWPNINLRNVWLGNNTITHLSLCVEKASGSQYVKGGRPHFSTPWGKQTCVSWAPALQLLSVERNQLTQLPEGLQGSRSLWILQLSYNRISSLQPGDLSHLQQLKELYLHHNFITSIHPQALQDVIHLKVLDLSFNSLITITPMTYLSLRKTGAEVNLHGISWQCDCRMRSVKRWMAYESDRGQPTWSIVCASPFALSGRDLLQLEDDDLRCINVEDKSEPPQDVTVNKGSQILLPCPTYQDSKWCTPNGEMSVSQSQAGLLINNITETDAGWYVCVSESKQGFLTVFNLQVKKTREIKGIKRLPRDVPGDTPVIQKSISQWMDQQSKQRNTQTDLALAVSLSVIITFLVAFILGVLARPFIDVLWSRVCTKKSPSSANPVSSTPMPSRQHPYENEAYCSEEEPEEPEAYRERRVTFSTVDSSEYINVAPFTVGSEMIHENAEKDGESNKTKEQSLGVSGSKSQQRRPDRSLSDVTDPGPTKSMNYEHIPDPDELENRGGLTSSPSSSSISVASDKEHAHQSSKLVKDPFQQRSHSPNIKPSELIERSIEHNRENLQFISEPFVDWSPHTDNDMNDSGETFEFPDSIRSSSSRSSSNFDTLDISNKNISLPSHNLRHSKPSTSSSSMSGDEPTEYSVNPYEEDEVPSLTESDSSTSQSEAEIADLKLEKERDRLEVGITIQESEPQWPDIDFQSLPKVKKRLVIKASSPPPCSFGISNEKTDHLVKPENGVLALNINNSLKQSENVSPAKWPSLDLGSVTHHKRYFDIQQITTTPDLSSSIVNNEDCKKDSAVKLHKGKSNITFLESDSSSSESEAEMTDHKVKWRKDSMEVGTTIQEPEPQWPDIDFQSLPKIKKRLDIKATSPPPCSFGITNETTDHLVNPEKGVLALNINNSLKQSENVSPAKWPSLDLGSVTHLKRYLDIKPIALTPDSSSSSSENKDGKKDTTVKVEGGKPTATNKTIHESDSSTSESEAEITDHKVTQRKDSMEVGTTSQEPEPQWPHIDKIKKRLDIKAPSPPLISIESPNETTAHQVKQDDECNMINITPEIFNYAPESRSSLDLNKVTHIKRYMDIKVICSSSASSSENEDYKKDSRVKLDTGKPIMDFPSQEQETNKPDPCLGVPQLQRRLDIKAPSPQPGLCLLGIGSESAHSDSDFSSSESKWENNDHKFQMKNDVPGIKLETYTSMIDIDKTTSQNISTDLKPMPDHESQWAGLNLGFSRFRKRLDITSKKDVPKASSSPPPVSSSSSSGSGDESEGNVVKQQMVGVGVIADSTTTSPSAANITNSTCNTSTSESEAEMIDHKVKQRKDIMEVGTTSQEPEPQWPDIDFQSLPKIKRRLEVSATSEPPDSFRSPEEITDYQFNQREECDILSHAAITTWPSLDLGGLTHIKRHLDIYPPSPKPDSSSSNSDSENGKTVSLVKVDRARPNVSFPNQEPETIRPAPSLGVPHLKKCLDIKTAFKSQSDAPPIVPSSPPPVSSCSNSESEDESSIKVEENMWCEVNINNVSHVKRCLDIKVPAQYESSSRSISKDETTEYRMEQERDSTCAGLISHYRETTKPDLGLGIPHIQRYLKIEALPPQTTAWLSSHSGSKQTQDGMDLGEFSLRNAPNTSSDNMGSISAEQALLPHEIRWNGIGRYLKDLSVTSQRRQLDESVQSTQGAPRMMLDPKVNSSSSTDEIDLRDMSENRRGAKGLSALKTLSSERRGWYTGCEMPK